MTKESIQELRARLSKDERVQNLIRMRAYEIFKSRRGQAGKPSHDWLQAENEVLSYLIQEESRLSAAAAAEAVSAAPPEVKAALTAKQPKKARAKQTATRKTKPASERETPKKKSSKSKKAADKKKS